MEVALDFLWLHVFTIYILELTFTAGILDLRPQNSCVAHLEWMQNLDLEVVMGQQI